MFNFRFFIVPNKPSLHYVQLVSDLVGRTFHGSSIKQFDKASDLSIKILAASELISMLPEV